jgi:glycogen synthase
VDLLIEALPVALQRVPSLRVAFVGAGPMHGHLLHRANELHVGHAVRLLGHMEGSMLTRVLRAAEAMVLPSRGRVAHDEGVVDLARRAGKAVVTTHSGPAHLVQHEKNGIVTYDNPGSMVWALDRVLGDPNHTQRLGSSARRAQDNTCSWSDVARRYLDLCAANFPELTESSPH